MNNLFKRTTKTRTWFFYWNGDISDMLNGTYESEGRIDFIPDGL